MSITLHPTAPPVAFTEARISDLTERELEVIELITNGHSNVEISRLLFLSVNSVKTYIRGGYRKIGARCRSHAVIWGVRHGLLDGVPSTHGPTTDGAA